MITIKYIIRMTGFAIVAILFFNRCSPQSVKQPVKIILDTDFGDDGDDLLSLVMLHHMQDLGECQIMAVGQANSNRESPGAIDVVNTFYNRPDIPIGIVDGYVHGIANQYSSFLIDNYPGLYDLDLDRVPEAVDIYRKVLAAAEDKSIVFVVIGFKKNMSDLLKSRPDDISPLTGLQLVEQKVKFVSDMGGWYPEAPEPENYEPFNLGMVPGAAKYYVENWPTTMLFTGIAAGEIKLAKKLRKLDTPTGRAIDYKLAHDGGWGKEIEDAQAGFDCVSTLIAVKGAIEFFHVKSGCNELDSAGYNIFSYEKDCGHSHIDCKDRKMRFEEIADVIEEMLVAGPKNNRIVD